MTNLHPMPRAAVQDVERIRAAFPALQRREGGAQVAYFDGPGGTQVPRVVADAITDYLLHHNANTHWRYPTSEETDAALARARVWLGALLGASADEIAFGANMTTMTFHVARALGRSWGPGDEIIVTELDHHANVAPWQALARDRGLTVRTARMSPDSGELDFRDLERLVTTRTKLVAIGAASNALGTITDVRRAGDVVHAAGGLLFVDAVHYAPHVLVDVAALGCDLLACSAYKFYGPHVGVLYGRRALVEALDVPKLLPAPDDSPGRLETGTLNHEGIVGAAPQRRVPRLALGPGGTEGRAAGGLRRVAPAGTAADRATVERAVGHSRRDAVRAAATPATHADRVVLGCGARSRRHRRSAGGARGVFVSHGDFYATTVIERLGHGPEGLVRAGCACYTTNEEVARLLAAVDSILRS